jgi:hypothetical protein
MPDFKCVACRIRTRDAGAAFGAGGDRCPGCGSLLESVAELGEVVGFRSVTTTEHPVDDPAPVGNFTARRNAMYAQRVRDALETERWIDDDGYAIGAIALPTAHPDEKGTT